jgi:hypothetical protein
MTSEERQLLKDAARNLLILLKKWDEVVSGMGLAISELYRAEIATPDRKSAALARLRLQIALLEQKGENSVYLKDLVRDLEWTGFKRLEPADKVGSPVYAPVKFSALKKNGWASVTLRSPTTGDCWMFGNKRNSSFNEKAE